MVLKLDRRYPLVWRTPNALQLGVDRPKLVIEGLSRVQEYLIAALVVGVARSGLDMIASVNEAEPGEVERLLAQVADALEAPDDAPHSATVEGRGPTADALRHMLEAPTSNGPGSPEFVVIVAHHVIDPELHGRWLREDVVHLPVVYGDSVVHIGPIVEPGRGPCLYCLELHHTDADPAWPAISAQLWGRVSTAENLLVASETAGIVTRLVQARLLRGVPGPATSIHLDAATGERVVREWTRHPDCQCAGFVDEVPTATRSGTEMASVRPIDSPRSSPRRGAAAAARG
jgi:hypothetical protein